MQRMNYNPGPELLKRPKPKRGWLSSLPGGAKRRLLPVFSDSPASNCMLLLLLLCPALRNPQLPSPTSLSLINNHFFL